MGVTHGWAQCSGERWLALLLPYFFLSPLLLHSLRMCGTRSWAFQPALQWDCWVPGTQASKS